jgi:glutaminyl-tRNA synthetase
MSHTGEANARKDESSRAKETLTSESLRAELATETRGVNFIEEIITADLAAGRGRVVTRFPPEPNGYLHLGHAKSICLNFGLALKFGAQVPTQCNLRLDDTNPAAEEDEFVRSIQEDVRWLGFDWGEGLYFASDYFDQLFEFAVQLIKGGKAYVDSQTPEQMKATRGDFHTPGTHSPFRDRSVEENLDLFMRMQAGEFEHGAHVLRAKIDMASPNINFRDPPIYRILNADHHRTGSKWRVYPMYDFAHGLSDAIEGITHSICTLEFEDHRPLYDWFLEELGFKAGERPHQYEFARLNMTYTVLSKRRLQRLVYEGHVEGWDDPRMPTIAGMRRRGYPPAALRHFCERAGVTKNNTLMDVGHLEHALRETLNATSKRAMAVLRPLKVVIENLPEGHVEWLEAPFYPADESGEAPDLGSRLIPFTRELYIEREDFMEVPAKKWFRLSVGAEVRLRYACLLTCHGVVKDEAGEVVELRCAWDPSSKGGTPADGRKVKGTLHWVSASHGVRAEVRLYDRLFNAPSPGEGRADFLEDLNPHSLERVSAALEPALLEVPAGEVVQFERLGYFCADPVRSAPRAPAFHRTISLKDSWAKIAQG